MKNIFKRKKRINLEAMSIKQSCEDKNTTYITFPDGLRLILRDGKYDGWYLCKENDNERKAD